MDEEQIGQFNLPEKGLAYRLIGRVGKDGKAYWRMEKVDKAGVAANYNLHYRDCPGCSEAMLVCNCNAFFWKGECKHVSMFTEIMTKREKEAGSDDGSDGVSD